MIKTKFLAKIYKFLKTLDIKRLNCFSDCVIYSVEQLFYLRNVYHINYLSPLLFLDIMVIN